MTNQRLRRVALWLLLWTGLGFFFASEAAVRQFPGRERSLPWGDALIINLPFYLIWGLLALPVLDLARRFPLHGARRWRNAALHLALGLAFSLAQLLLSEAFFELVRQMRGRDVQFLDALMFSFRHNFHVNVLTYWGVVALRHLRDYDRGLREKELVEERLRGQLARAELAALRTQLQPHFLFNALNSISSLLYRDAALADRMIVHLSELLRRSLESDAGAEVALSRELDFVRSYLALAGMRHGDRLRAEITIPSALTVARVPSLLLQPLVENAVMHGVERSTVPCRVEVRARLAGESLVIEVENDLPPAGAPARRGSGVGLDNVRARLAQLYGARGCLTLDLEPSRGALARVTLPFIEGSARHQAREKTLQEEMA